MHYGVPHRDVFSCTGAGKGVALAHDVARLLGTRYGRVEKLVVEHDEMGEGHWNYDVLELTALRFVNRQGVRQPQEIASFVKGILYDNTVRRIVHPQELIGTVDSEENPDHAVVDPLSLHIGVSVSAFEGLGFVAVHVLVCDVHDSIVQVKLHETQIQFLRVLALRIHKLLKLMVQIVHTQDPVFNGRDELEITDVIAHLLVTIERRRGRFEPLSDFQYLFEYLVRVLIPQLLFLPLGQLVS